MSYEAVESLKKQLRYFDERIRLYGEKPTPETVLSWIADLKSDADLIDWDSAHDECYSGDYLSEYADERVHEETRELRREIQRLETELEEAKSRRSKRRNISELRACSHRVSDQVSAIEARCDQVAYQLNRTERYTPEWEELNPLWERLCRQREQLQGWQKDLEAQIGRRRKPRSA